MKESVSELDIINLKKIRKNVSDFMVKCSKLYDKKGYLLDIAPQDHEGATPFFKKAIIHTLDINPLANATYTADICNSNTGLIKDMFYDFVICTEVLEHTLNPFMAISEIYRILKKDGYLFLSVPFNFRIHGPLPDCWRFTEHGLKQLLKQFTSVEIIPLNDETRFLMPIQYTVIAIK